MKKTTPSNSPWRIRALLVTPALVLGLVTAPAIAGKWTEEDIMREIAYMAKELLDMSGKESIRLESPAFDRPFMGVCSEPLSDKGLKITCVTPGTQAAKAGLLTGDIVLQMKGQNLVDDDIAVIKERYYKIVKAMKTGDDIEMVLNRDGKTVEVTVTVGALSHPAYVLEVNK